MYEINKMVGFLVSPIGGAITGGLLALICARLGRRCLSKWIVGLTVAWLWLWMTPVMTWVVGVPLEREFLVSGKVPAVDTFPKADAIVLLGGSMGIETNLSAYAEMWTSADRVWQAARLWKAGKAPIVIATSGRVVETTFPLLKELGIPGTALMMVDDARNTEEEARSICKMLGNSGGVEKLGVEESNSLTHPLKNSSTARPKVLLVTSAWHMKRARMMFEKYAPEVEVVCAPADFENSMMAARAITFTYFLPDPGVFIGNSVAVHEWVGIVGYKLFR